MGSKTGEGAAAAPFPLPHPGRASNNREEVYTKNFTLPFSMNDGLMIGSFFKQ